MKKIPRTELKIMKYIWKQKEDRVPSKEVMAYMKEEDCWSKGATSRTLARLVDKDFLKHEKIGINVFYTALIKEDEYIKFETQDFLNFVHDKSIYSMISALGDCKDISDEELEELERWINSRG